MAEFQVQVEQRDAGAIARLRGNADNAHADDVRRKLTDLLERRSRRVVIDLSELAFIASLVIGELLTFRREIQAYGGELRLAGPAANVEDVFRTTRLVELFPVFPDAEQALCEDHPDTTR
jgi:anti-sigma B factor antagonist